MKKLIKFYNTLLILAVTIFFQSCTKTVDLIVHNGNIYTVDENFSKVIFSEKLVGINKNVKDQHRNYWEQDMTISETSEYSGNDIIRFPLL